MGPLVPRDDNTTIDDHVTRQTARVAQDSLYILLPRGIIVNNAAAGLAGVIMRRTVVVMLVQWWYCYKLLGRTIIADSA